MELGTMLNFRNLPKYSRLEFDSCLMYSRGHRLCCMTQRGANDVGCMHPLGIRLLEKKNLSQIHGCKYSIGLTTQKKCLLHSLKQMAAKGFLPLSKKNLDIVCRDNRWRSCSAARTYIFGQTSDCQDI